MSEKATFGVNAKLEIKTEVPSDASGRLVHALSDSISPLTEWLGLIGDKVRIHRKLVVDRLVRHAEEEIAGRGKATHPVPLKLAVPLLELASQEEPDDDYMVNTWARLLASAATSYSRISTLHLASRRNEWSPGSFAIRNPPEGRLHNTID